MSLIKTAFKGAVWLSMFRGVSQVFSWVATIFIARILIPEDYGLMEMATVLTGYVFLFVDMGLGSAVIQKEEVNKKELDSLFWFMLFWGFIFSLLCVLLAYPTTAIFKDDRIFHITQAVGILFLLGAFQIIPRNLLHRQFEFKKIGIIDASSIFIASGSMIFLAKLGAGVWTLIFGTIIKEFIAVILAYFFIDWRPSMYFKLDKIKPFLKFGVKVAGANSLYYAYEKSDRFFGGRSLGAHTLGYYAMALQLSSIITEKLIYLINSVSFTLFSRYQKMQKEFNAFYLNLVKMIAFLIFPLFIGGIFFADQLIPVILGEKWLPIIIPFKMLCGAQLIISLSTPNEVANNAQGRPHWVLYLNIVSFLVLPLAFYFAAQEGLYMLAVPWLFINPLLKLGFTYKTLRKIEIKIRAYIINLMHPAIATIIMLIVLSGFKYFFLNYSIFQGMSDLTYILIGVLLGILSYGTYILLFQRDVLASIKNLLKSE